MARQSNNRNFKSKFAVSKKPASKPPAKIAAKTEIRNTAIPRPAATAAAAPGRGAKPGARVEVTHELISRRAYEIHCSGAGGSEFENWIRAERELRSQ
jgi:hypothetical protein